MVNDSIYPKQSASSLAQRLQKQIIEHGDNQTQWYDGSYQFGLHAECSGLTMLSANKHNHRSSDDMAPDPVGLLNKMRKSLAGKHLHRDNNSGHSSEAGSKLITIPQMDPDTALAYMRDASFDRSRLATNNSLGTEDGGHDKYVKPGSTSVENGSPSENGRLLNGTCTYTAMDENANKDDYLEPKKSEVGTFEKQGARPKVPKSSKTDCPFNSYTSPISEDRIETHGAEPLCVEMAQPHFPAPDTSHTSCSSSTSKPTQAPVRTTSEEIRSDLRIPHAVPESTSCELYQEMPSDSVTDHQTYSDLNFTNSSTGLTENTRRVHPESSHLSNSKLESGPISQKILANGCQTSKGFSNRPKDDLTCSEYDLSEKPSTIFEEKELHLQHSLGSCDKNMSPSAVTEQSHKNPNAALICSKQNDTVADETLKEDIFKLRRNSANDMTGTCMSMDRTCSSEGPSKHCCTCTCNKSKVDLRNSRSGPPAITSQKPQKLHLILENIPQELEDLPKPPRTPNIEVLVNRNQLFLEEHTKAESLSEQDLPKTLGWNAFSVPQETCDSNQRKDEPQSSDLLCNETTKAFNDLNVSQPSTRPEEDPRPANSQDSHGIFGATGGSGTLPPRPKAPTVDRSSKPKELAEAASLAAAEPPPPLPPRVPISLAPSVPRRPAFGTFPVFDDDDDDDFPTHEFLHEINMSMYVDPSTTVKSRSLPRNTSPSQPESPPELRAPKRGKTVNMRNRLSQMLRPGYKKKRHSTHGFPDRPLPDIPLNPRHPKNKETIRETARQNSSLFGTTTGDIVSQQAVREGLLREVPTKDEVDRAREQFAVSLRRISEYGWYWGPMSWDDAETRLENMPDGSFLVRDSSDDRHLLSLSFRAQGSTHHTRVEHHNGKFSFWSQPCSHGSASIVEFVEEAMRHSHSGRVLYFLRPRMPGYPPAAVQLLYPISRFQKSRSLQHMCRFVIRRHVRLDHIDSLPLPRRLRDYLKEAQYYTQDDILH